MNRLPPIAPRLLTWAARHGRHDLPWQREVSAYRVWISEIMLQQTQVATVIPYFERFMQAFPDVESLAAAPLDDVLAQWSGLGYYARARNLHKAARIICRDHGGRLPPALDALQALPGIGRSTAAAILALAYRQRAAILDGNAKRVLARYHAVSGWPGTTAVARQLWAVAERETPDRDVAAYTQAIMDLGATVCTRSAPDCDACPLEHDCLARAQNATGDYPGRRPRRQQPSKSAVFALLDNGEGRILLERRPPSGIWGGLWCLPEWLDEAQCRGWLRDHAIEPRMVATLDPIEHAFTHFRLQLKPLWIHVSTPDRLVNDSAGRQWLTPVEALALGLPAPIRQLIESLQSRQQENTNDAHRTLRKTG